MAKDVPTAVKDAVHKLQLCLLEGIKDENQLLAAGSLMSERDYQDVVTERSIANMCGYPLCQNSLPSDRPWKGHYRISLREHKVYDLHETYMYCSTDCVISSKTFAGSLQKERCSGLNPAKVKEILRLFEELDLNTLEDSGKNRLSSLKIQEKADAKTGEISLEEWIGPSNAIEGYIPLTDQTSVLSHAKIHTKGSKPKREVAKQKEIVFDEKYFTSTIITQDEYIVSKSQGPKKAASSVTIQDQVRKTSCTIEEDQTSMLGDSIDASKSLFNKNVVESVEKLSVEMNNKLAISEVSSGPCNAPIVDCYNKSKQDDNHGAKASTSSSVELKSSLKSAGMKKVTRSVTWADDVVDVKTKKNISNFRDPQDNRKVACVSDRLDKEEEKDSHRYASAEACARALREAAEAAASGSDVDDAVTEAGIIVLPHPEEGDEVGAEENYDISDTGVAPLRPRRRTGSPNFDLFESEDSWYDTPPKGFSMTLSPFATMFSALFAWVSSSSIAFVYGQDDNSHENYLSINGREYPRKIVMMDGRSSEIKQALAECLSRALPGLVSDLRLPTPVSTLEHGMGQLLETMSFIDPLPSLRVKQWQIIVLLFLDALSVCRIPALAPYMTGRRIWLPKVLDNAQIGNEEYEVMKDLLLPLGRLPHFSMQSGG